MSVLLVIMFASCLPASTDGVAVEADREAAGRTDVMTGEGLATLVLGGGCFWCLEAAFEILPGVTGVESGYAGGSRENPSYEQVSTGLTGHAEVVRIAYDPARVSLAQLFELFFRIHDPTTEDRQGADVGSQYRSIILYADEGQKAAALEAMAEAGKAYRDPLVTDLEPLAKFWPAEDYHQDFFRNNPEYGYCRVVVAPKVDKAKAFVDTMADR